MANGIACVEEIEHFDEFDSMVITIISNSYNYYVRYEVYYWKDVHDNVDSVLFDAIVYGVVDAWD